MIKDKAENVAVLLKSSQATDATEATKAAPAQATDEGIDRNYAIKIKTMWCHFYGSFSMSDARCPMPDARA